MRRICQGGISSHREEPPQKTSEVNLSRSAHANTSNGNESGVEGQSDDPVDDRKDKEEEEEVDGTAVSKEGCSRVAIHRMTGIVHSYTLECSYARPASVLHYATLSERIGPPQSRSIPPIRNAAEGVHIHNGGCLTNKAAVVNGFEPQHWAQSGEALLVSVFNIVRAGIANIC